MRTVATTLDYHWNSMDEQFSLLSQLCNYSAPTQMCKIYKRGTGGLALLKQVTHDCKWSVFSVFIICPSPPRKHFHIRLETNVAMNMRLEFSTRKVQTLVSVAKLVVNGQRFLPFGHSCLCLLIK